MWSGCRARCVAAFSGSGVASTVNGQDRNRHIVITNYHGIITIEPGKRSGKPCIRGLRITAYDVLEYLASGMSEAEILEDFPELSGKTSALVSQSTHN
jgi:uncharacterized protein (DUF433 family)